TEDADAIDVVTKTWAAGIAASVAISPTSDSEVVGTCNPFTITVRDSAGQPVAGVTVDVEQTHVRATNNIANDEPTVDFCVPTTGVNRSEVDVNRGDLRENPDNRGTAGGETRQTTDASGQVTIGLTVASGQGSDGTGTVNVVAFVESTDNDDPDAGEPQATATKTWVLAADARTLDCDPESATNVTGTTHTVTCTARDRSGAVVAGEGVTFSESGPGDISSTTQVTTNAQGVASATVTSSEVGTQTITGTLTDQLTGEPNVDECERAANDPSGAVAGICADSVTKTWTAPPPVACPGFEGDARTQVVGTVGGDSLIGTEGDDIICALGGDDIVDGLGGDDLILLGGGNDGAFGRDGNDVIRGAGGDDLIAGGDGRDRIFGGAGNDGLKGNRRGDVLRGGIGNDILVGGPGNDRLFGGGGSDNLRGNGGGDLLNGKGGFDTCRGGRGGDVFRRCERRRK
ncbi:MAG: Ig-like domain-containing protein, partial [Actinomycetota bacterium]|nr:Ig-like domain-containing protein [Actinomycetota bacterium]